MLGPLLRHPLPTHVVENGLCATLVRRGEADPDWWHPDRKGEIFARPAKTICRSCPVQLDCFNYAKQHAGRITGIWGGQSFGGWRNPRIQEEVPTLES